MHKLLSIIAIGVFISPVSYSQTVKIVGLGASSCSKYLADIQKDVELNKQYLAWAQGFMNGVLVRAPAGIDDGLDLLPEAAPVQKQIEFLQDWCVRNVKSDFSDASFNLFKDIRSKQGKN